MINKKSNIFKRYCHSICLSLIFEFKLQDHRLREAQRNSVRLVVALNMNHGIDVEKTEQTIENEIFLSYMFGSKPYLHR